LLQSWKWAQKYAFFFHCWWHTLWQSTWPNLKLKTPPTQDCVCCVSTKKHMSTKYVCSKCKVCRPAIIVFTIQNQTSKAGLVGWEIFWEMVLYLWIYTKNDLLYSRNLRTFSGNNFVTVINNTTKFSILWFLLNIFYWNIVENMGAKNINFHFPTLITLPVKTPVKTETQAV
jgi:hypothetical protein